MKKFIKQLCYQFSRIFMLQEILNYSIIILLLGLINCVVIIIDTLLMLPIRAGVGIAKYTDEQGAIYTDKLKLLYKSLNKEEE